MIKLSMEQELILDKHTEGVCFKDGNYVYDGDIEAGQITVKDNIIVIGNVICASLHIRNLVCKNILQTENYVYFFNELTTDHNEKLGRLRVEKNLTVYKMIITKVFVRVED